MNTNTPTPHIKALTAEDMTLARMFAADNWRVARVNGYQDKSFGRVTDHVMVTAYAAEVAVCRFLGLTPIPPTRRQFYYDGILRDGRTFDVKFCPRGKNVCVRVKPQLADMFILVWPIADAAGPEVSAFDIRGWVSRERLLQYGTVQPDTKGSGQFVLFPHDALTGFRNVTA